MTSLTIENSHLVVSAMRATDPALADAMDAENTWQAELLEQGARVDLYRKYDEGEHRSEITTQMRKMLRLSSDNSGIGDFNDNYCAIIVAKMMSRLQVAEITTGQPEVDKSWLIPTLERNDWAMLQGITFEGAIRDGDSFILIDPATLQWSSEPAYDGFSGVVAIFDSMGKRPVWACKLWSVSDTGSGSTVPMQLIVYQPSRITYWQGEAGGSEVRPTATLEVAWQVGQLPLVHFVNKFTNFSSFGRSEIRSAIPLQDVLNRTLHSMVMASEFSAFLVKWSKGIEIDAQTVTPGAVINLVLKDAQGHVLTEMSPELVSFLQAVEVGQFEATDIGQYISQIDKLARELSQISQTPIYGVTTEGVLSGEALRQLEVGLIGKCVRFQKENTDAIRQLVQLTAMIQNSFTTGLGNAPTINMVNPNWKSPELLDAGAQITVLLSMRKDAPGLWDDDFYRGKIGGLLNMRQADIEAEGLKARNSQDMNLDRLVGAGGSVPVVV